MMKAIKVDLPQPLGPMIAVTVGSIVQRHIIDSASRRTRSMIPNPKVNGGAGSNARAAAQAARRAPSRFARVFL
jgi:hypothetical protein